MITTLDPGRAHRTLNVEDNIVYSKVWDKKGFPVDIPVCTKRNLARLDTPNARFRTLSQTPEGQLLGYRDNMSWEELERLGRSGSPIYRITEKTRPITILHGDADGVVPLEISQRFYISLVRAGLEKQSDLFIVHNGGHGTREFFQPETQQVILAQLRKYLGRAAD